MDHSSWHIRSSSEEIQETHILHVYAIYPTLISLKLHHGGSFTKFPGRRYVKGKTDFIDLVDTKRFCLYDLRKMMVELGHEDDQCTYFHFKIPGKDLDDGLQALGDEEDVLHLLTYSPKCKMVEVYTEFLNIRLNTYFTSPHGSKVVIEKLPDTDPHGSKKKPLASCKKKMFLGWHAQEDVSKESEVGQKNGEVISDEMGSDVGDVNKICYKPSFIDVNELGKQPGMSPNARFDDVHLFEEFNPFDDHIATNEDDDAIEEDVDATGEDSDFKGGEEAMIGDVEVNMKSFVLNTNTTLEPNVDGDVNAMSLEELESASDSDVESVRKKVLKNLRREENEGSGSGTHFYVGQVFGSKDGIKDRIDMHAVETKRDIHIVKNDLVRIRAVCKGKLPKFNKEVCGPSNVTVADKAKDKKVTTSGEVKDKEVKPNCPWVLHISIGKHDKTWMVKTHVATHKCLQTRYVRACTATWLSQQIADTMVTNPDIPVNSLRLSLEQKFVQRVSHMKTFRAKIMAEKKVRGDYAEQYTYLRDYICELQRTNPNTTVKLDLESEPNLTVTTRQFRRIYVCLGALKDGFKAGMRDLLGLDGAFMKGPFPGQILTAVGIDPNHGTYPLAYAIVEAETTNSWSWFLECLGDDLDLYANSNFTFISDRQKGIIPAIAKMFPCADHRFCLRHIYENMKLKWKGRTYKDHLWKCATACTVPMFEKAMEDLKKLNAEAYEWLKQIPPKHWSRSHFKGNCHSDVLLNNMCEVFNKQLVDGRDKPIIAALEYIREYLMKRIVNVQKVIDKSDGPLTPTATKMFDAIKTEAAKYTIIWNGGDQYQVSGPWLDQCVVDVNLKVCSCRRWELTGMPCKHAVATIWNMSINGGDLDIPEEWVHEVYRLNTWKAMYSFKVKPITGRMMWPKFNCPYILIPPKHHIQVGRPKKKRRKTEEELSQSIGKGSKLSRLGKTVTCVKCKKQGHNSRTCKGQESGSKK